MRGSTIDGARKLGLLGLPLLAIMVAVMVFAWSSSSSEPAQAFGDASGQLVIPNAIGGPCSATKCNALVGRTFTLSVKVTTVSVPVSAPGYSGIQTEIFYPVLGVLKYEPDTAENEIVWPPSQGVLELRSPAAPTGQEGVVNHAASSAILPPRPTSAFLGNIVEIDINCTAAPSGPHRVALVPFDPTLNTNGSALDIGDGNPSKVVPIGPDTMDINCQMGPTDTPTPTPTSTPEVPSIGKSPALSNLFLTRQGAKIP
ncbi:MAG: hypothetical protein U1B78_02930, partial [Dehalococcoidia bacterium]|nr:hypothetical protein [Dehalococcoidia bacterium]